MKRLRWHIIAASIAAGLAGISLVFAVWLMSQGPGQGEVSVILHGAFIGVGLLLALVLAGLAVWFVFWHVKWLRWLGLVVLVAGILAMLFGRDVQLWLIEQRMADSDRKYAALVEIEAELYERLQGLSNDQDAALAVLPTYMTRINAPDVYDGDYTEDWNTFAYVHTIYMFVLFGVERDAQYSNQRPPYAGLYCIEFRDEFGKLVVTDAQQECATVACPDYL